MADRPLVAAAPAIAGGLSEWLRSGLIVVSFAANKTAGYNAALSVARSAAMHETAEVNGKPLTFAAFGRERPQAEAALVLIRYLRGAKGVQIYAGGALLVEWARAESVLQCYLTSLACADRRAHCQVGALPCRHLAKWQFRVDARHPSSPADQIQAAAVRLSCDWCPSFNHLGENR